VTTLQEDLFGNLANSPTDRTKSTSEAPSVRVAAGAVVNDMDLTQEVLADIASEKASPLHVDDAGRVRRCGGTTTEPVAEGVAVVVEQLTAAQFLTTRRGSCPVDHGVLIVTTRAGRNAAHRWKAYRRPSTWGPTPDPASHHH
jgi:hypothetical protein